jgi:mRNA interferase HigB
MLVILPSKLSVKDTVALGKLNSWKTIAEDARWKTIMDIKVTFASVSGGVKNIYTIFNIGGNDYRLITIIDYETQTVFVEDLLTHADYDKWNKK